MPDYAVVTPSFKQHEEDKTPNFACISSQQSYQFAYLFQSKTNLKVMFWKVINLVSMYVAFDNVMVGEMNF